MLNNFYKAYRDPVFRYHLRLTECNQTAEELTQETFFQACRSVIGYRQESTDLNWLYGIAKKVFYRYLRNKRRHKSLLLKLYENYSPEKSERDSLVHFADILNALPEQYSRILILRAVEDMTHKQISEILGTSEENSRILYYRARKKFLQILNRGDNNETII